MEQHRKREWDYRYNGKWTARITGKIYSRGMYLKPVLQIWYQTSDDVFGFENVHYSEAKHVKTLKNRLRKFWNVKDLSPYETKKE